ncbi:hypothetical protein FRC11_002801, partial [Ceratobasidium sp. 423]
RYIQDSNQGHFTRAANFPPVSQANEGEQSIISPNHPHNVSDQQGLQASARADLDSSAPALPQVALPSRVTSESTPAVQPNNIVELLCATQRETNRLPSGNEDLLRDIRRTLFSTSFGVNVSQ